MYKRVDIRFHTIFEIVNCLSMESISLSVLSDKVFCGQIHYGHLLVPEQENCTHSTPLLYLYIPSVPEPDVWLDGFFISQSTIFLPSWDVSWLEPVLSRG